MTGGVVYQMLTPEMGFTQAALQSRLARGAHVRITPLEEPDLPDLQELLGYYQEALLQTDQPDTAELVRRLCQPHKLLSRFLKILPEKAEGFYLS